MDREFRNINRLVIKLLFITWAKIGFIIIIIAEIQQISNVGRTLSCYG